MSPVATDSVEGVDVHRLCRQARRSVLQGLQGLQLQPSLFSLTRSHTPNLDRGQAELCDLGSGLLLLPQLALDVLQPLAAHVTAVLPLRWIMIEEFFFLKRIKGKARLFSSNTD